MPTFQRVLTKRKHSLVLEQDGSASTLQVSDDCVPLNRGQPSYDKDSSDTGDPCDSGLYIVSSFHHFPIYSAYRTQNTTSAESGPSLRSAHYSESARGHGRDVKSTGMLLSALSNTWGSFFFSFLFHYHFISEVVLFFPGELNL